MAGIVLCNHPKQTDLFKPSTKRQIRVKVKTLVRCRNCGVEKDMPKDFLKFLGKLASMTLFYNPKESLGDFVEEIFEVGAINPWGNDPTRSAEDFNEYFASLDPLTLID